MKPALRTILALLSLLILAPALIAPGAEKEKKPRQSSTLLISPGEKAKVSLFGIEAEGYKFVYVFDRSGSMDAPGHHALPAVKAELIRSLQTLDSVHQFQIIFYNERPRLFSPTGEPGRLVFGSDQNKRLAENFINSVEADGGTDHEEALMLAIKAHPDVIFLLTDGDDPQVGKREFRGSTAWARGSPTTRSSSAPGRRPGGAFLGEARPAERRIRLRGRCEAGGEAEDAERVKSRVCRCFAEAVPMRNNRHCFCEAVAHCSA